MASLILSTLNLFRAAVPFSAQTALNMSSVSPIRDFGRKKVERLIFVLIVVRVSQRVSTVFLFFFVFSFFCSVYACLFSSVSSVGSPPMFRHWINVCSSRDTCPAWEALGTSPAMTHMVSTRLSLPGWCSRQRGCHGGGCMFLREQPYNTARGYSYSCVSPYICLYIL